MPLDAKSWLLVALGLISVFHLYTLGSAIARKRRDAKAAHSTEAVAPSATGVGIGFVTNFFDTLGIGSFAPTTSLFRFFKSVPDENIPGTLNVGHTIPTLIEAYIFIQAVQVDPKTLILMISASTVGAWLGAGVVSGLSRERVQRGMGICLLVAAILLAAKAAGIGPAPGVAEGVTGVKLMIALVGNLILGALMTLGIGLYGPCLILVSMLGMNPKAAFPIMMGSCAFLMPVASARFTKTRRFDLKASLGLIIGGAPAVLIAALIVKEMDLKTVMWLVVVVVLYTSVTMLRAASKAKALANDPAPTPA
jgi:uncharacterized membrane protein YfcA